MAHLTKYTLLKPCTIHIYSSIDTNQAPGRIALVSSFKDKKKRKYSNSTNSLAFTFQNKIFLACTSLSKQKQCGYRKKETHAHLDCLSVKHIQVHSYSLDTSWLFSLVIF